MGMGIAEIGPSILGLMILIVLNRAIKMNCILDGQTLQRLKEIAMIVTVIIFLTVTSTLLEGRPGKGIHWILRIVNGFEFSLSPWSSYLFALTQSEKIRSNWKKNVAPIVVGSLLALSSTWNGWVFTITPDNHYIRGPLFFVNLILNLYGFVLFVGANYINRYRYEKEERRFLNWNYVILFGGIVLQLIWEEVLLLWPSVAVAIFSYYLFLNEKAYKYDPLTQTYNRQAFQNKLDEIAKERTECFIIVMDLNGLKQINDKEGHLKGDTYIRLSAEIVNGIMGRSGRLYRIGGDEFCILCEQISDRKMAEKMNRIERTKAKLSEALGVDEKEVGIAYGYEKCTVNDNVREVFQRADNAMYAKKKQMKG